MTMDEQEISSCVSVQAGNASGQPYTSRSADSSASDRFSSRSIPPSQIAQKTMTKYAQSIRMQVKAQVGVDFTCGLEAQSSSSSMGTVNHGASDSTVRPISNHEIRAVRFSRRIACPGISQDAVPETVMTHGEVKSNRM